MRTPLVLLKILGKVALHASGASGLWSILVEDVPEIANNAWNAWSAFRDQRQRLDDVAELLERGDDPAEIYDVVDDLADDYPEVDRDALAGVLTGIVASARRTYKRPADPTGRSLPAALAPRSGRDLIPYLDIRPPRFKKGDRPLPGTDWELDELLGIGGYGEVWRARHRLIDSFRPVALKFCIDPAAKDRLLKHEATICARVASEVSHPGVIHLRNTYLSADPPCLEYEYVAGGTLANLIRDWHARDPRPSPVVLTRHILAIVDIVAFVHRISPPIAHRDLKPANILVMGTADEPIFKVADFGIGGVATLASIRATQHPTRPGALFTQAVSGSHTPLYSSPEQARGGDPDPRDDVHALGVIWHQMLTGDVTEEKPSGSAWKDELIEGGMAPPLIAVLDRCFEKAKYRHADASALAGRIRAAIDPVVTSPTPSGVTAGLPTSAQGPTPNALMSKPQVPPDPEPTKEIISPASWAKLVLIPAGTFEMGDDSSGQADETPRHTVTITNPFYLGVYPVTQAEYEKVTGQWPSHNKWKPTHPVETVSWFDAVAFCNALSEKERLAPYYQIWGESVTIMGGPGYRLPTEAEWEYACRAGSTTQYWYGDSTNLLSGHAWYMYNSNDSTQPVGGKPINPFGLHDVHGNTWEWCWDKYDKNCYEMRSSLDPAGPTTGDVRVLRGGSFKLLPTLLRSAYRIGFAPKFRSKETGFRLSRNLS